MLLKGICIRKNVSIRQIIGLGQMREESEKNNVWQLLDMIPLLFGTCEYEARYYYENQVMESAFETPLSSCMIVNDYCLTFNADLKNLIIYREEEVHQIYSEYFEKIWKEKNSGIPSSRKTVLYLHSVTILKIICLRNWCILRRKAFGFWKR